MSKRNFIILIIFLIIAGVAAFWLFSFLQTPTPDGVAPNEGTNFLSRFNPFGKSTPTPTPTPEPTPGEGNEAPVGELPMSKLRRISNMPVAGFGVFQKERYVEIPETSVESVPATTKPTPPMTEFAPALRYVDRVTGNIYQTFADKIDERKFSTTVIARVSEAYFGNKGTSVIMRYLKTDEKTIQTFVGILPKELLGADTAVENELKGTFLPDNVTDVSVSLDTNKLFYLFNMGTSVESTLGTTMEIQTGKKAQIFENSFTEWLPSWSNQKTITLTTRPAASVPGYMYALDPNTKSFSRVFGGINGLTTLMSPDGKLVLYGDNNLSLYIYHTDTKNSDTVGLRTLPEKCVWGASGAVIYCAVPTVAPPASYPDVWYQGQVSFSDQIWQINIVDGTTSMLLDTASAAGGEAIDGIKLALDQGQNYLFFVNKKNSMLWELNLR